MPSRGCGGRPRANWEHHPSRRTADLHRTADHQIRDEGAACRQRGERTHLGPDMKAGAVTAIEEMLDGATATAVDPRQHSVQRVLLVWDAPNLDMGLGSILGGRPHRGTPAPIRRAGPLVARADR